MHVHRPIRLILRTGALLLALSAAGPVVAVAELAAGPPAARSVVLLAQASPVPPAPDAAAPTPPGGDPGTPPAGDPAPSAAQAQEATQAMQLIERLADLRQRIADREQELRSLRAEQRALPAGATDADLQARISAASTQIAQLRDAFEQLAIDGLDMSVFSREAPTTYDWQSELLEVVRPLLASLKELTEKPRRIEALRRDIERTAEQLRAVDRAVASIEALQEGKPAPGLAAALAALREQWLSRRKEIASNRELYQVQLARLEEQDDLGWEIYLDPIWEFLAGRGLTLLLALAAAIAIWILTRVALAIVLRVRRRRDRHHARSRERAALYLYRGLTVLLIGLGVLTVFYLRSDMLLLALAIVILIMSAATLRQALPRYVGEIRLLLNWGTVREGERLVYEGVPMRVVSIGAFAILANPELTGYHRVSLDKLEGMQSRPVTDEPWFPCRPGEFLMLEGDRFVEVVGQSVEQVRLRFKGSEYQTPSAALMAAAPLNLSRDGFVYVLTFGLDYSLQPISLDAVPARMEKALQLALAQSPYIDHHRSLLVAFNNAAAHSLDYLIVAGFDGKAAGDYWAIGRLLKRTLVAVCNEEGWSIPFEQLTVHVQAPQPAATDA